MDRAALEGLSQEELIGVILAQAEVNAELARRVAELEAKLGLPRKTPENSGVPPSQGQKPQGGGGKPKGRRRRRPGVARALEANPTRVVSGRSAGTRPSSAPRSRC